MAGPNHRSGTEQEISDLMKVLQQKVGLSSQNTGSAGNLRGMASSGRREPREKAVTPGKSEQDNQASGEQGFICVTQDRTGERVQKGTTRFRV